MPNFTIQAGSQSRVELSTSGAAITGIWVPDASGNLTDVTVAAGGSAGKTIGRYANRIARGTFELDGQTYTLLTNENGNTLHGGPDGFSKREWDVAAQSSESVEFVLHSPDGDQGFPGAMEARIRYTWTPQNELVLEYTATTDKPTVVNFTNHVYFNLSGGGDIAEHRLRIDGSSYTPLDAQLIPTGEIAPVEGTEYDFRTMRAIGGEKYDVNVVLDGWDGSLRVAGRLEDPRSGRAIDVLTAQPGLQLYTGKPGAVALETQHFADAPHHPNFPSTVLRPGEVFRSKTIYRFM